MKTVKQYFLMAVIILSFTALASSQTVLIWDNDNNSHYSDPETGILVNSEYGLQQALIANHISYTTVSYLPGDLSGYDIVFVELGIYCVG